MSYFKQIVKQYVREAVEEILAEKDAGPSASEILGPDGTSYPKPKKPSKNDAKISDPAKTHYPLFTGKI